MLWFFVKAAGMLLAVLFWVARKLRLTVPLLYALTIPTLFRLWYLTHVQLAEVIFFGLLAVSALSWAVSLVGWAVRSRREARDALDWVRAHREGEPMRIETGLRRAFWPKRGNGGLEIGFDTFVKPDRHTDLRIGFGNFAEPDGHADLRRRYLTNRVR